MNQSVFRSAPSAPQSVPTAAPVGEAHVATDSKDQSAFYTYEGDNMRPYTADYFEVSGVWDEDTSLARDLREIEGYIREQVHLGKLENTTKAAAQFIKELERKAELTRHESGPVRIQKLLSYIDFRKVVDE